jgi:FkbM family methyltransferase
MMVFQPSGGHTRRSPFCLMNPRYLLSELAFTARQGVGVRDRLRLARLCGLARVRRLRSPNVERVRFRDGTREFVVALRRNGVDAVMLMQMFHYGEYDAPGIDWSSVRTIVDAGANIGLASLMLHARSPSAKIVAIEPERNNLVLLRENLNVLNGRVATILDRALWHTTGELDLGTGDPESHSLVKTVAHLSGTERVKTITMPEILHDLGTNEIDVVKIDIEGAELDLFSAPDISWVRSVRYFLLETHSHFGFGASPEMITETLAPYGFTVDVYNRNKGLMLARRTS